LHIVKRDKLNNNNTTIHIRRNNLNLKQHSNTYIINGTTSTNTLTKNKKMLNWLAIHWNLVGRGGNLVGWQKLRRLDTETSN